MSRAHPNHHKAGAPGKRVNVIAQTMRAALQQGLRRTIADKRNAVQIALADPECSKLSDREIARRCCVSNTYVSKLRKRMPPPAPPGQALNTHGTASVAADASVGEPGDAGDAK